jgi:DNA-binding transcriptional regulator YhcF (GntR family)
MKKMLVLISVLFLLSTPAVLGGDKKQGKNDSKEKLAQKIEQMKEAGATEAEIQAVIADYKKATAKKKAESKEMAKYKEALNKKVAEMKAAGASDDEIKKVVVEYKKKIEAKMKQVEKTKATKKKTKTTT